MTERNSEKEIRKEGDNFEGDPTKKAFFSDMEDMEEEIAAEAIELVRHALSLLATQFYDDSIEILRQAIGLYAQINKLAEIDALNNKISEIYLLKEKTFRDRELETGGEIEITQEDVLLVPSEEDSYKEADSLIVKAIELVNNKQFDAALDAYDDAIRILKNLRKSSEIEKINELIEDCYNRKAEFLREQRIRTTEESKIAQQTPESEISELELKAQRIRAFEEAKRKESEKSNQAYELIGKATELKKLKQFDESIKLLKESVLLFEEINWTNEVNKIKNMIEQTEDEKVRFQFDLQQIKEKEQQDTQKERQQQAQLLERATVEEQVKQQAQVEALRKQAEKEQEETAFQNEISEMINHAEKIARDYDIKMKKGVKKGVLVEECVYPAVIKIYERVRIKVSERGWKEQVAIYNNQINHYKALLEKDEKLREIESQKLQKQKDFDDSLKLKEDIQYIKSKVDHASQLKEQRDREVEIMKLRKNLEKSVKNAEIMAREYEFQFKKAVKSGNLNFESKYPEIIKIISDARDSALEKGWDEDARIYSTHIRKYADLYDKEKKVRELEGKKDESKKIYEDFRKIKKEGFDPGKLKQAEAQKLKELDEKKFQEEINNLVDEAEKMARDYDVALKKSLKEGNLIEDSPFSKIIDIYSQIRDNFVAKGWKDQVVIYNNQIKIYQEKWENDKKLRELEHQKIQKQREYEESLKIKLEKDVPSESIEEFDSKQQKLLEDKNFQDEISKLVNHAEKMARDYELAIKKALKKGKLIEVSPYIKIIEIYTEIRNKLLEKGWIEQSLIYTNQIKVYQEKLENDKKLRELELKKALKQEEFEKAIKDSKLEETIGKDVEKLKKLEELAMQEGEEEKFTREIDDAVEKAEKEARKYELAIKKGSFELSCPYMEIAEVYRKIREKVFARGWKDEAEIYGNQIKRYQEKFEKDKRLRELEAEKIEKQKAFEEALKTKKEPKILKLEELEEISRERSESDEISAKAMDLIDEAEKSVRSYELSIKKDILTYKSPYANAISNYEKAYKLFQTIGWNEDAQKLQETIKFYRDKKVHDDNLRVLEQQKVLEQEALIKKQKIQAKLTRKAEEELLKMKTQALEVKKRSAMEYESKKEQAFNFMDLAKNELKQNNFEKAISYYNESEKIFAEINWAEGIRMIKESINVIKVKKDRIEREAELIEKKKKEKLILEAQIQEKIIKAKDLQDLQQEQRRKELLAIQEEKEREREISEKALRFLEEGTKLKDDKKFEEAYEKYITGRDLFKKIGWDHEVSRINNDLLVILKKEMKQTEKLKEIQKKKVEEKKELEDLLKEADEKQRELEKIRKAEKRKQREKIIQKERDAANEIIKTLRYNEGILALRDIIKKIENTDLDELSKEIYRQIEVLESASQVPIITNIHLEGDENTDKFKLAYQSLDNAQISLSNDAFMKAITELNEALYNLNETNIGKRFISAVEEKIETYKKEMDIKETPERVKETFTTETDDLRAKIAERRAERRRRIQDILDQ